MLLALTFCAMLYIWRHPAGLSLRYGTLMGVVFGLTLLIARMLALERQYAVRPINFLDGCLRRFRAQYVPTAVCASFVGRSVCAFVALVVEAGGSVTSASRVRQCDDK